MEKLLVIAEKPSAAQNFATALGGMSGTFEGDTFAIVNLFGHILAYDTPEKVAYPNYAETVGKFENIDNLPWQPNYFDFDKKIIPNDKRKESAINVISSIKGYLKEGYIPVIASDIDPMGEGDVLVQEVLNYVSYKGKVYREYHADEAPKSIQKAMKEKKDVTARNDAYVAGMTRSGLDFLTQQIVRMGTITIQRKGYRLPRPIATGRLQATLIRMVGDQIEALANYKPSSVWESRYKLGDLVLTNPDIEQFPTKEAWNPGNLPATSMVKETKVTPGHTAPPKALSLTGLSKAMATKGISSKRVVDLTQAMYEDCVITYPRTEDNFISHEQFEEMLPNLDDIIRLMGLSPEVFTHREPRKTHVKEGGSHGALRPGITMPSTIDELDTKYGKGAATIYRTITERFLMMFLEDTEWVRHDYETTETPVPFKGSVRIITKAGVTDPDENTEDVIQSLPDISKPADLFAYEVKSTAPKKPTESWILGQLEKHNVGTAATQTSTVSRLIGPDNQFPLVRPGKANDALALSPIGQVSYQIAREISLGTPECTRNYEAMIKEVIKGTTTKEEVFAKFTEVMKHDIEVIQNMTFDFSNLSFQKVAKKVDGIWQGQTVHIPDSMNGYTFTQSELNTLFNGGEVEFAGKDYNGNPIRTKVCLGYLTYKGKQYIGFRDANYYYGSWNGEEVKFKRSFMGYAFSDAECQTLCNGGEISFTGTTKEGKQMELSGKLAKHKTENGVEYVGLQAQFPLREGYVRGTFHGETVSIKGSWSTHTFTNEEIQKLFAGETITIPFTKKDGSESKASGKLAWQTYQGKKFLGFKADFGKKPQKK